MESRCEGQRHMTVYTDHNFWRERRAKVDSNRGPFAYQPNAQHATYREALISTPALAFSTTKQTLQLAQPQLPAVPFPVSQDWQTGAHSEHRFPAPSSPLCQKWLRLWLKGHSLSPPHSEHRFPAPSSKLCRNCLRHRRDILLSTRSCPPTLTARPLQKVCMGTNKCVEAT